MALVTGAGDAVIVGQRLAAGGQGEIFTVSSHPDQVFKRYLPSALERDRALERRLAVMTASPPPQVREAGSGHLTLAWPTDTVRDNSRFTGFLMPAVDMDASVGLHRITNPTDRSAATGATAWARSFTWRYLVATAANLAQATARLHAAGVVIGDFNHANARAWRQARVTLLDCDSMQVTDPATAQTFLCRVGRPEFTPPELAHANWDTTLRTPSSDLFALAIHIYQLLLEGEHPFRGTWHHPGDKPPVSELAARGIWANHDSGGPLTPRRAAISATLLPPDILDMFAQTFETGATSPAARPTAAAWHTTLQQLLTTGLTTCGAHNGHIYPATCHTCPWCAHAPRPLPRPRPRHAPQPVLPRPQPAPQASTRFPLLTTVRPAAAAPLPAPRPGTRFPLLAALRRFAAQQQPAPQPGARFPLLAALRQFAAQQQPAPQPQPGTRFALLASLRQPAAPPAPVPAVTASSYQVPGLPGHRWRNWLVGISVMLVTALAIGIPLIAHAAFGTPPGALAAAHPVRAPSPAPVQTVPSNGPGAAAFSPGGTTLAVAGHAGAVKLVNPATGRTLSTLTAPPPAQAADTTASIAGVAFSHSAAMLAVGLSDGTVTVWNLTAKQVTATMNVLSAGQQNPDARLNAIAFSPDGTTIAAVGNDGPPSLWNAATGKQAATLTAAGPVVYGLAFSPDGATLAVAGLQGISLWDVATRSVARTISNDAGVAIAFSPDGTKLATISPYQPAVDLWNSATGRHTATLQDPGRDDTEGLPTLPTPPQFTSIAVTNTAVAASDDDGSTFVWSLTTGKRTAAFTDPQSRGALSAAFSTGGTGGQELATSDENGTVYVWAAKQAGG